MATSQPLTVFHRLRGGGRRTKERYKLSLDTRIIPHEDRCVKTTLLYFRQEELDRLPHSVQLTLEIILNLTQERGYCWAYNQTLADKRCVGITTVKRHIETLIEEGFLRRKHVGHDRRLSANGPAVGQQQTSKSPLRITKDTHSVTKGTKEKDSVCKTKTAVPNPEDESAADVQVAIEASLASVDNASLVDKPLCTELQPSTPGQGSPYGVEGEEADKKEFQNGRSTEGGGMVEAAQSHSFAGFGTRARTTRNAARVAGVENEGAGRKPPPEYQRSGIDSGGGRMGNAVTLTADTPSEPPTRHADEANPALTALSAIGVPIRTARQWLDTHGTARVQVALRYLAQTIAKGTKVPSPGGFVRRSLERGWGMKLQNATPQAIASRHARVRLQSEEEARRLREERQPAFYLPPGGVPKLPPLNLPNQSAVLGVRPHYRSAGVQA